MLLKRNPKSTVNAVEILTTKRNSSKKLKILRVNVGVNLFVEDSRVPHPDLELHDYLSNSSTSSKWEIELELQKNRFTIKFNEPTEEEVKDHPDDRAIETKTKTVGVDYNLITTMDQRMSVLDLKIKISKELKQGLDRLIFLRGGSHGQEIKEDDLSIKVASLYNNCCIFVKRGIPSRQNEKRLKFLVAESVE